MFWLKVLLLTSAFASPVVLCSDEAWGEADTENWVDPGNMFDYDAGSKTMRKSTDEEVSKEATTTAQCQCEQEAGCGECKKDLASVNTAINKCQRELNDSKKLNHIPTDFWFFKQFISQLVQHFGSPWGSDDDVFYQMSIKVTRDDLKLLSGFSQGEKIRVQEAHGILSQMVLQVEQMNLSNNPSLRLSWREEVGHWALIALQVTGSVSAVLLIVWLGSTLRVSLVLFIRLTVMALLMTIPWTWWHLYLEEIAKRHSDVMKEVPLACRDVEVSWFRWLSSLYTIRTDECYEFQRNLLVDPMWDVPPTKAVAVTLTRFLMEPLEHIALGFKRFIVAMVTDVPVMLYFPLLLFSMFLLFLLLIFLSGYRVDILYLFSLSPGNDQRQRIRSLERENESLQRELAMTRNSMLPVASAGIQSLPVMQAESIPSLTENVNHIPENVKSQTEHVKPLMENVKAETEDVENVNSQTENVKPIMENEKSEAADVENVKPLTENVKHSTENLELASCLMSLVDNLGPSSEHTDPIVTERGDGTTEENIGLHQRTTAKTVTQSLDVC
ncbi:hypothetical protein CAPTEDRAFT_228306 [Capitella teleta]|uniref:Chloride channel CLIC-like protein 1 n=1 Tax=Capitella teleta TaxID=283909 RepID=R7URA0_CAPTE|nr:hypothetical protein CAPTEDRAFT_228306 [Capitella teleta]|eukprot:ELU06457.1 hypothetical protein CAPTEDRAFT_228306 [Capitella teleta]